MISVSAMEYSGQAILVDKSSRLSARIKNGNQWSALHCLDLFNDNDLSMIKLTEIMYHPTDFDTFAGTELEFLEIKNTSTSLSLDIGGLQITNGVDYTFPFGTSIVPQGILVLASNAEALIQKCPNTTIFGEYEGQLSNSGERIEFASAAGDTIISMKYNDKEEYVLYHPRSPLTIEFELHKNKSKVQQITSKELNMTFKRK